jgi:hypothetical protein
LWGVSQRSISKNPLKVHQLEQHIKLLLSIAGCTVHAWKLALDVKIKPFPPRHETSFTSLIAKIWPCDFFTFCNFLKKYLEKSSSQ